MILLAESEGPDQTAQMPRLILVFTVRLSVKAPSSLFYYLESKSTLHVIALIRENIVPEFGYIRMQVLHPFQHYFYYTGMMKGYSKAPVYVT